MPDQFYVIEPPRDAYELEDCNDQVQVVHDEDEHVIVREVVVYTRDGVPGGPGPPGPPGPGATEAEVDAYIEAYNLAHPMTYEWTSPGPVSVVDFNHPLPFNPNVELRDSAGTQYLVMPIVTPGHVHIDLGGALMSVVVVLS